jgi:predicted short-subunit dehydrogenase-like oxidoreductase (DUF2520 family)
MEQYMQQPVTGTTLNVIGAGRVGTTLAALWHQQRHFAVQDVVMRSPASVQAACARIGAGLPVTDWTALRPAAVWMLAVPDAQIEASAARLAQLSSVFAPGDAAAPIAFHCSGAKNAAALEPLAERGWRTASAHCILSFANVETALQQFPGTPCALEGNASACAVLRAAFSAIGARCFDVRSEDKLLYHAAAVFATNFLPVLQATAEDLWQATGMPPELVTHLRAALLRNAVDNITALGPQRALTGPAARGDTAAIARQGAAVAAWDAPTGEAYAALSALALRLAARRGA